MAAKPDVVVYVTVPVRFKGGDRKKAEIDLGDDGEPFGDNDMCTDPPEGGDDYTWDEAPWPLKSNAMRLVYNTIEKQLCPKNNRT